MKNKKRYYIILIILIIFALTMYFVLGKENIKKSEESTTIIIGNNSIWNYSDRRWLNITNESTINSINWLDYEVHIDNKKIGKYYLWYDGSKWYMFDENRKAVVNDGNLIAYRSNYDIKIKDFQLSEIKNYYYVNKILKENNINNITEFTATTETTFDLDNDGKNETLYFVSNVFPMETNPDTIFSIVFMVKNNEIYPIYTDIAKNNSYNGCKPYLSAVLDVDNDNTYELVVSCGRYSIQKPVDMLYKLTDNGFKILISNQ